MGIFKFSTLRDRLGLVKLLLAERMKTADQLYDMHRFA